ncbi:MAG: TerC family protein [Bryobacterales bacterium]|nr:TerC family protein [Bryobacterales bacterium]
MAEYWPFLAGFIAFVLLLLTLDLTVFHKRPHAETMREAGLWVVFWLALAVLFNIGLYFYCVWWFPQEARLMAIPGFDPIVAARQVSLEFLAGYVIEESLSIDNIFVFVVVMNYFAIPAKYQHRVLFLGIIGAIIFRGIFISLGALLMTIHWVIYVFGVFLIITGLRMAFSEEKAPEPEKNPLIRVFRKMMPVTPSFHGQHFFARIGGKLHATPLFIVVLFLEATDIVFAVDSVPAIFAVTREPLIVFTSNIFAILGLRALYFLLAGAMDKFYLLRYGLAAVLVFVGLKMVWLDHLAGGKFPIGWSLGIIALILGVSVALSLLRPLPDPVGAEIVVNHHDDPEKRA